MFATKLFVAIVLLVGVSARNVPWDEDFYEFDEEYSERVRRDVGQPPKGVKEKIPLAGNDERSLSVLVYDDRKLNPSQGVGLALDHVNGHGASVLRETSPGGTRLTGSGHATLFQNDNHKVGVNGQVSRTMPDFAPAPSYNTYGGGVDYSYKYGLAGASLGMSRTPLYDRTDYKAQGNLNLFKSDTSSFDLNAGFRKFDSPYRSSAWEPNFGASWSSIW